MSDFDVDVCFEAAVKAVREGGEVLTLLMFVYCVLLKM